MSEYERGWRTQLNMQLGNQGTIVNSICTDPNDIVHIGYTTAQSDKAYRAIVQAPAPNVYDFLRQIKTVTFPEALRQQIECQYERVKEALLFYTKVSEPNRDDVMLMPDTLKQIDPFYHWLVQSPPAQKLQNRISGVGMLVAPIEQPFRKALRANVRHVQLLRRVMDPEAFKTIRHGSAARVFLNFKAEVFGKLWTEHPMYFDLLQHTHADLYDVLKEHAHQGLCA